jgi:hypothetical protein
MPRAVRPRKLLLPEGSGPESSEIFFSDQGWANIRKEIPGDLSGERELDFKNAIQAYCSIYFGRRRQVHKGAARADAIRKGGAKQAAPFDRLQSHLLATIKVLSAMEGMNDPFLGLHKKRLEEMLQDITKRADNLRSLSPVAINSRHELVRSIAKTCERFGFVPSATGRVYEEGAASWFQKFVAALNDNLLGEQGWGPAGRYSRKALYADVAKALRGDG